MHKNTVCSKVHWKRNFNTKLVMLFNCEVSSSVLLYLWFHLVCLVEAFKMVDLQFVEVWMSQQKKKRFDTRRNDHYNMLVDEKNILDFSSLEVSVWDADFRHAASYYWNESKLYSILTSARPHAYLVCAMALALQAYFQTCSLVQMTFWSSCVGIYHCALYSLLSIAVFKLGLLPVT